MIAVNAFADTDFPRMPVLGQLSIVCGLVLQEMRESFVLCGSLFGGLIH